MMHGLPIYFSFTDSRLPQFLWPFVAAYAGALVGTFLSIHLAHRLKRFDHPGERSSHSAPIPRFGGVGIAIGFFLATSFFATPIEDSAYACAVWTGGLFALLFGLFDDVRPVAALPKLACQFVCAIVPPLLELTFFPGIAGFFLAFCWILFFMNAYNFMDGMDGMTASFGMFVCVAMLCPLMLAWYAFGEPHFHVLVLLAIAASLLGFSRFNISRPARTFMGDGGSQMIGYLLAIALLAMPAAMIPAALLAFWPFIYDVSYTLIKRTLRGENLLAAHREHLYQRLLRAGMTHRQCLRRSVAFHIACVAASIYASIGFLIMPRDARSQIHFVYGMLFVLIATILYTFYVIAFEKRSAARANAEPAYSGKRGDV